ncbi:MAG: polyphenol oxidase family protein, partial [Solirubrobacteraceae bacterium]
FFSLAEHIAVDLPGARVAFTTRRGGWSKGPYESLNLGAATEDDPRSVARNRTALRAQIRAPELRFVRQVHGPDVMRVAADDPAPAVPGGADGFDGQATDRHDVALVALTADCLPIAIAGGGAVAMIHAGWRGLAAGIVAAGVRAVVEIGGGGELSAAIGPGAGGCCYETGDEVRARFDDVPAAHAGRRLDLRTVARARLEQAGVRTILDVGICTICSDPGLLFSHRRDGGVTGRQAGVAWLT